MIAWAVASSQPTLCMKEASSASPKVMVPKQRGETFRPHRPRVRSSMACSRCGGEGPGPLAFEGRTARARIDGAAALTEAHRGPR